VATHSSSAIAPFSSFSTVAHTSTHRPRSVNVAQARQIPDKSITARACSFRRNAMCKGAEGETGGGGGVGSLVRELLPAHVKPTHYDVTLEPHFDTFKFDGSVTIDIDVVETTNSVSVNTFELEIGEVELKTLGAGENTVQ